MGEGFTYLLRFANTKRIAIASNAVGVGQAAIEKAVANADNRVVFGNPIGSYQAIQHPLADSWAKLAQDELMIRKAAWLYDHNRDCGAEANAVKLRASEDSLKACERAIRAHGGIGYVSEYDVERYWQETMINVIASISNEMVRTTSLSTTLAFQSPTAGGTHTVARSSIMANIHVQSSALFASLEPPIAVARTKKRWSIIGRARFLDGSVQVSPRRIVSTSPGFTEFATFRKGGSTTDSST